MEDFGAAIGLVLVLEGALYALFPVGMQKLILQVSTQPPATLRAAGLAAAVVGVAIVWALRG
jgi:uncharacterized protein YjeT (DUF2065 family)